MTTEIIADTLTAHPEWTWNITHKRMSCAGCDWSQPMGLIDPCGPAFRQHQAEQVAAALSAAPAPRDDLTMFAALVARLGGEARVTWAEARRLQGVTVTRYDDPANMAYRFELGSFGSTDPTELTIQDLAAHQSERLKVYPGHQCESWQIRRNDKGDRYCAACGAKP